MSLLGDQINITSSDTDANIDSPINVIGVPVGAEVEGMGSHSCATRSLAG